MAWRGEGGVGVDTVSSVRSDCSFMRVGGGGAVIVVSFLFLNRYMLLVQLGFFKEAQKCR